MTAPADEHLDCPTCGAAVFVRGAPTWRHEETERCACGEHLLVIGQYDTATAEVNEPAGDPWREEAVRGPRLLPARREW